MAPSRNVERNAAVAITPEALAKIVSDAVAFALAAYEQRNTVTRRSGSHSQLMRRRQEELAKLAGEMGIAEYELEALPAAEVSASPKDS